MLSDIAENLKASAQYFLDFKIQNERDLEEFAKIMKEYESKGDVYIHELVTDLNKTFITPLEREDILKLAVIMDDILDGYEQCAARLEMYGMTQVNHYTSEFAENLNQATEEVHQSVHLLNKKKFVDMRTHLIKINDYESKADELLRVSIKSLFSHEDDPIQIIQYKELSETLEEISDSCEDVANTLETIIMRNA